MKLILLAAPLALAACVHTPCPAPRECVTPDNCVCLVTSTVASAKGRDGNRGFTAESPAEASKPADDSNGARSRDESSDSNGGRSRGRHSRDDNGGSSDENGGKS